MRSISSLIASLLRVPEVTTVQYDPASEALRLRFLLAGRIPDDELVGTVAALEESLGALAWLGRRSMERCEVHHQVEEDLTWIEVVRDPFTLTVEEVYLACDLLRDRFADGLVVDDTDPYVMEQEALANEELIAEVLSELRHGKGRGPLVAMREDGRVMVYSK